MFNELLVTMMVDIMWFVCCGQNLLRPEDEEHEESYWMLKLRERRQLYVHDYSEEYCEMKEYGDLVVKQRLQMVHWIMEVCYEPIYNAHYFLVEIGVVIALKQFNLYIPIGSLFFCASTILYTVLCSILL